MPAVAVAAAVGVNAHKAVVAASLAEGITLGVGHLPGIIEGIIPGTTAGKKCCPLLPLCPSLPPLNTWSPTRRPLNRRWRIPDCLPRHTLPM